MSTDTSSRYDKWRDNQRSLFAALFLFITLGAYHQLFTGHHTPWTNHTLNVGFAILGPLWLADELRAIWKADRRPVIVNHFTGSNR